MFSKIADLVSMCKAYAALLILSKGSVCTHL